MATEELGLRYFVEGWQQFFRLNEQADKQIGGIATTAEGTAGIISGGLSVALGQTLVNAAGAALDALIGVGEAAAGFVLEGFDLAVDFQSSLADLSLAAGSTGLSMEQLHDVAIAVGGDARLLGVSASGAAEAMTGLFRSGLTATEVFGDLNGFMEEGAELGGVLRAAIDLAAATTLDMVQAADLGAVVLSTFGGELETEAERAEFVNVALNNLVQAADASVAEVDDLAEALKFLGPEAFDAGYSIQDTNNALAILSTRGVTGSMAGTGLRQMLASLRAPTDKAAGAIADLGITLRDEMTGELLPMPQLIGNFNTALADMDAAQRDAALGAIFTTNGLAVLNPLLAEGTEGWEDMSAATANAATTQEQAALKAETFAGQMEAFEGQLETLQIQIGEALLPVATDLLAWFSEMVEAHGPALVAMFQTVADAVTRVVGMLVSLLFEGELLNDYWAGAPEFVQVMLDAISNLAIFIMDNVVPVIGMLIDWLSVNLPPAIHAVSNFVNNVLLPALTAFWDFVQANVLPVLAELIEARFNVLVAVIQVAAAWFTGVLLPALTAIWGFISANVLPILAELAGWLADNLPPAIQAVADFMNNTLLPAVQDVGAFVSGSLIPFITSLVNVLGAVLAPVITVVAELWSGVLQPALEIVAGYMRDNIVPLFGTVFQVVLTTMGFALRTVAGVLENVIVPALRKANSWLKEKFGPAIREVADVFLPKLQGALDKIGGAIQGVIDFFQKLIDKIASVDVPEWMKPGSPPPLFYALQDIGRAMRTVSDSAVAMGQSLQAGALGEPVANIIGSQVTPVAGASTVNNQVSNINNNSTSQSTTNNNFIVTPDLMLETVGQVAAA